jgi:hypothetical protein
MFVDEYWRNFTIEKIVHTIKGTLRTLNGARAN